MDRRQFLESAVCASALSTSPLARLGASVPAAPVVKVWDDPEFEVRGLEIHSRRMWEWKSVSTAFALMEKLNLNTLIFHQDDIVDTIVWPDKYFPVDVRNGQRTIQGVHARAGFVITAREYLRKVASEAKKRHITFFFEVCEIWYPDGLTELYPEILGAKGTVCPTSPFWWEFRSEIHRVFRYYSRSRRCDCQSGTLREQTLYLDAHLLLQSCSAPPHSIGTRS